MRGCFRCAVAAPNYCPQPTKDCKNVRGILLQQDNDKYRVLCECMPRGSAGSVFLARQQKISQQAR